MSSRARRGIAIFAAYGWVTWKADGGGILRAIARRSRRWSRLGLPLVASTMSQIVATGSRGVKSAGRLTRACSGLAPRLRLVARR